MIGTLLTLGIVASAPPPKDAITVDAYIKADALQLGKEYEIILTFAFKDGWSGGGAGISAPLLQIEVPDGVELTGRHLTEYADLAKNEFLQEPYERLLKESPTRIGFRKVKPTPGLPAFRLNFLAYLTTSSGEDAWFVRRRFLLPVGARAAAEEALAIKSDWGVEEALQIGDPAAPFTLPRADGSKVSLDEFRGKKNVVVTTYRAHW